MLGLCGCMWAFSSCGVRASYCSGFSGYGARALGRTGFSSCSSRGLHAPRHVESSRTRDRTCVPCIDRRILNHWTILGFLVNIQRRPVESNWWVGVDSLCLWPLRILYFHASPQACFNRHVKILVVFSLATPVAAPLSFHIHLEVEHGVFYVSFWVTFCPLELSSPDYFVISDHWWTQDWLFCSICPSLRQCRLFKSIDYRRQTGKSRKPHCFRDTCRTADLASATSQWNGKNK